MRGTIKIFIKTLATLSFRKIVVLLKLILRHPLFFTLSFYATFKSYHIAKKYFPKTNSSDGIGNAYRHALWCCLILMYCCKISAPRKALLYCKKMTDLHEELFPNEPLQKKMDLHNNQVGMDYFMELLPTIHRQFFETSFFVETLFEKTKTAAVCESVEDDFPGRLIYLRAENS